MSLPDNEGPIAQIDLDGTLADYDKAMRHDMRRIQGPDEIPWEGHAEGEAPEYVHQRVRLIRQRPGWWENLERYEPGFEILHELQEAKFHCHILTKGPESAVASWTEKVRWCQKHVPGLPITVTQDKGLVYGRVLVDDWPEYIARWLKWRPRGIVIMPAHPWNLDFQHPRVVRYTGTATSLAEVRVGLLQAKGATVWK